ncbi:hypothetical protein ABFX02_01G011200 [Erythranthe guttata]
MGRKIPLVSFLCGVLSRKKTPPPDQVDAAVRPDDNSPFSTAVDGDATTIPNYAAAQPPFAAAAGGGESSGGQLTDAADQSPTTATDQQQQHQPLPPPPGIHHHRSNSTASCHRHHQRSNSAASKLMSSMSMRVLGGGGCGGGGGGIGRQEKTRNKDKKFSHEDSIWKKTIILGEKCRVPDEDEDSILYDEKGRKISTYHPKTHSGTLSYARQSSSTDQQDSSRN